MENGYTAGMGKRLWAAWVVLGTGLAAPAASAVSNVVASAKETGRSNTFALEVSAIIDADPMAVRHTLLRQCQEKNLSGSLKHCQIFKVDGAKSLSYSISKYPFLNPRDVVLERTISQDFDADGKGAFVMSWHTVDLPGMGERKGHVRPSVYQGFWKVEPAGAGKSRILYLSELEPGGSIPMFIFRWATKHGIPKTVEKLEEVAAQAGPPDKLLRPTPEAPWQGVLVTPMDPKVLADMAP